MNRKNTLLLSLLLLGLVFTSRAQTLTFPCPPNSDFEAGNYTSWHYYYGTCCTGAGSGTLHVATATTTPPAAALIPCSFVLTGLAGSPAPIVTGIDPFGGFPVVGAGNYSLRIGSTRTEQWAEMAEYFVPVPASATNYSLIYKYAVVIENPSHPPSEQPRFLVQAFDSTTGDILPCASFFYAAPSCHTCAGSIPGFGGPDLNVYAAIPASCANIASGPINTVGNGPMGPSVYYKPWATTSINLSAYSGHTIKMTFTAGDCALGGHFGYGYVDMTCGTFAINSIGCGDTIATVSAPSGFANYSWYDSLHFSTLYGTTQTVTFPTPAVPTTYAVIMSPYAGFGCPDTLYTRIQPNNLQLHPSDDTSLCNGQSTTVSTGATDIALPLSYFWSPSTGLNCVTCATPIATPFAGVNTYTFVVTDAAGCNKMDSLKVTVDSITALIANTSPSCFGYSDGSATVTPTSGTAPYVYKWNTVPVQTNATAIGLAIGTYVDTVTDHAGCFNVLSTTVTQPPPLTWAIASFTNPDSCLIGNGTITLSGLQANTTYTVSYVYDSTDPPTIVTSTTDATGTYIISGLFAGKYDSLTVITTGCPYNIVGPVVLTYPADPALPFVSSNSPICYNTSLTLTTTDVTAGVVYSWSGPNGFSSTAQSPAAISPATFVDSGFYVVTVNYNNCFSKDSTFVIVKTIPNDTALNNGAICSGDTLRLRGNSLTGATYLWNGPNGFISTLQDPWIPNAQAVTAGTYTMTITVKGCSNIDSTIVAINQTPAPPIVTDTNYCQFTTPVPALNVTGTNVIWYTTSALTTPSTTIAPTPTTGTPGITTWYVTQMSATTPPCPSAPTTQTVGIYTLPNPTFSVSDSVFCRGTYFTFTVNNANTGNDYEGVTWNFMNTGTGFIDSIVNTNPVVYAFDGTGSTVVTAEVYYNVCPDVALSHNITVYPFPVVTFGADTSICPGGDPIIIVDSQNLYTPQTKWQWSTGDTLPLIRIVAPGTYYCKVTINGCTTSDTVNVLNDCYMDIPNVFTPNGDGLNDYFYPRQLLTRGLTTFSMNIYNRWGQLVFTTNSIDGRGWDGTFNGVAQPQGVFVYVIDATFKDGQKEHRQGNITLLR